MKNLKRNLILITLLAAFVLLIMPNAVNASAKYSANITKVSSGYAKIQILKGKKVIASKKVKSTQFETGFDSPYIENIISNNNIVLYQYGDIGPIAAEYYNIKTKKFKKFKYIVGNYESKEIYSGNNLAANVNGFYYIASYRQDVSPGTLYKVNGKTGAVSKVAGNVWAYRHYGKKVYYIVGKYNTKQNYTLYSCNYNGKSKKKITTLKFPSATKNATCFITLLSLKKNYCQYNYSWYDNQGSSYKYGDATARYTYSTKKFKKIN